MKSFKKHLALFCLVLSGCGLAFGLAEGFVRVFYPYSRDHVIPAGLFVIDGSVGWKLKAGKTAVHHSRYFDVVYTVNSLGYRDAPRDRSKLPETWRILLYGDSQIFGWGIPTEQRFSNLIEQQSKLLEVWNLAVPGYGLDQQILSYLQGGASFNANEVIFFISNATLERTRHSYIYKKHKPLFVTDPDGSLSVLPVPENESFFTRMLYKTLGYLYLPYFVERRLEILKGSASDLPVAFGDLQKQMLILARNIAWGRKHRITVLSALPEASSRGLQNFCDAQRIRFLAITLEGDTRNFRFDRDEPHWNLTAHKQIAEQLLSGMRAP